MHIFAFLAVRGLHRLSGPLITVARLVGHRLLALGLGGCVARPQVPRGTRNLLGPEIEPVSPALAGGLPTTGPPEESWAELLDSIKVCSYEASKAYVSHRRR